MNRENINKLIEYLEEVKATAEYDMEVSEDTKYYIIAQTRYYRASEILNGLNAHLKKNRAIVKEHIILKATAEAELLKEFVAFLSWRINGS